MARGRYTNQRKPVSVLELDMSCIRSIELDASPSRIGRGDSSMQPPLTTAAATWLAQNDHHDAEDGASLGRIRTKVCERQSWSWGPCSDRPTETFEL